MVTYYFVLLERIVVQIRHYVKSLIPPTCQTMANPKVVDDAQDAARLFL